jgi:hypothetical protein
MNGIFELKNFTVQEDSITFKSGTGHQFKIILNAASSLTELLNIEIQAIPFNFLKMNEILAMPIDSKAGKKSSIC